MAGDYAKPPTSAEAATDLTGSTVGRFAIRAHLGTGGMGEVYRAHDTKLKRSVALKRIAPEHRTDEEYRSRLWKEAERASRLSSAHIAGIYDVLEEKGEIFLVMEYVEGQTLRARLRARLREPLATEEFLRLAVQCTEALVAAHEKGVVHRDIKPENIMVTPAGQAKILDFGVAKRLLRHDPEGPTTDASSLAVGTRSGTPAYMAPETLLGREVDERVDIFSLGVVFYEALTGLHPFRGANYEETAGRILHQVPLLVSQHNSKAPAELDRIVAKMLAKDPEERYATAADLVVDLRRLDPRFRVRPLPVPPPPRPWYRRRASIQFAGALLAALVVVIVLAIVVWPAIRNVIWPPERIPVAVVPFANQTGDARLDDYRLTFTQFLVQELTGSPNIRVFPYEQLVEIIPGMEDPSSPAAIQAIADFSNSQYVVVPAMYAIGNTVRVQAESRVAHRGKTIPTAKVERERSGSLEETLYLMIPKLADRIQESFKHMGPGEEYQPREDSRPKTAEAAFYYTEGKNALAQGDYAQALRNFQRAIEEDPAYALAYAWMGQIYGLLGYDDKAREVSEEAVRRITPQTPAIDTYFIQANLAERKYDYSAAEEKYLELIGFYPDEAIWHASLAEVYGKQGQYQKAIARYQAALRQDSNYIVAHQKLGRLYRFTGDLPQAMIQFERALRLYRGLRNREGEANALLELSEFFRVKGEYQQARQYGQQGLEIFEALENEFGIILGTLRLGNLRFNQSDFAGARRYWQEVLDASGEIRNNRLVVTALMNIGVAYSREGDYAKAIQYYERSVAKEWPALRERAQAMSNLAIIYIDYGPDPERGFQLVQEALETFQMMGDAQWEAQSRMLLGSHYINIGRYEEAVRELRQAQRGFRRAENKARLAQATYDLGRCYFVQNQYERALEFFEESLGLFQELEDSFGVEYVQIYVGWTYDRLGDSAKARALLEEALQAAQENRYRELLPDAYAALGELHRHNDKPQARQNFQRASDLWKEPAFSELSVEARSYLGLLEAERGRFQRALAYSQQSVARARQLERVHTLAQTLINLARVYLLQQEYRKAIEVLDELTSPAAGNLGLEFRAQAFHVRGQALEGLGKADEAKAAYSIGQGAILQLQQALAPEHRESFAARPDIQVLLP